MKSATPIIENDLFTIRKLLLIFGIVCFVLGIVTVSIEWRNLGSLLLLASVFLFFGLYFLNGKYKEYEKTYFEYLPKEKVSEMLKHGSFEFTNEKLIYRSKNFCEKINWTELLSYSLVGSKHIVLFRKNKTGNNLIISETEMDKSDFKKVVEFIKERVEKTTYNNVYN